MSWGDLYLYPYITVLSYILLKKGGGVGGHIAALSVQVLIPISLALPILVCFCLVVKYVSIDSRLGTLNII